MIHDYEWLDITLGFTAMLAVALVLSYIAEAIDYFRDIRDAAGKRALERAAMRDRIRNGTAGVSGIMCHRCGAMWVVTSSDKTRRCDCGGDVRDTGDDQ
jgi:hypothetical protein